MNRILFLIVFFFIPIQFVFSDSADSLKWIEMPVKTYPDYPVLINYIDSSYFNRHKKNYLSYASSVPIVKKKRTIKVKCANKTYKFKDSRNEDEQKYYVAGSYKSWIIIKGYLYYHFEQYYMINPKTGEIDSLAGEPLFYDDKILCIEGDNTDGTKMIEVWQIDDDTISLRYSADLKRRRIYDINDFYLFDDTIFLKLEERYLKMYYAKPTRVSSTYQGLQPFKYNGKELDRVHGLDWYDYGARRYDPAFCQFTQMDPLCEQYPHLSPYAYCAGNPVRYVDPDGKDWYENEKGQMAWTDHIDQKSLDDNKISGRYMGKVVLIFNGSRNEKLGKGENLFGKGAVLAKATLYGRDGADDITEFDGFTMSSDFKTFGAIDDGEYNVNYKYPGKGGSLSSHWAINNAGPVDCLDGINPNPFSAYSSTQKAGVYIHRPNNNGWAGTDLRKKTAVSTGCLLIVPSRYDANNKPLNNGWDQFNEKLSGVKSFKLILVRK